MSIHGRLQTTVGPADMAADALRVCPMASGFGFAEHVIITSCHVHVLDKFSQHLHLLRC